MCKQNKTKCGQRLTNYLQTKDLNAIDNFFESLRGYIMNQATAGSEISVGAFNGLGIFASSLANDERMKEKYIPQSLDMLIQSFFTHISNSKMKKVVTSNLMTVIMVAGPLIFPKLPRILDIVFNMKKDGTNNEMNPFSNRLDESIFPIVKEADEVCWI